MRHRSCDPAFVLSVDTACFGLPRVKPTWSIFLLSGPTRRAESGRIWTSGWQGVHPIEPTLKIYSPESQLRSPKQLATAMLRDVKTSRELAWRLAVRDIKAQYRQSIFGLVWAFVPPVALALLFIFMNRAGVINFRETKVPYPVFVLVGTTLWHIFAEALTAPMKAMAQSRAMLTKIYFPREAIALSALAQALFGFAIRALIIVVALAVFKVEPSWWLALTPLAALMLIAFGFMLGMLLVPIGALYTDISAALPTFMTLWLLVTPVVYPPPDVWPYSLVADYNPVSPLLTGVRDLTTTGPMDSFLPFVVMAGITMIGMIVV